MAWQLAVAFFDPPTAAAALTSLLVRPAHGDVPEGCAGVLTLDLRGQPVSSPVEPGASGPGVGIMLGVLALALGPRPPPAVGPLLATGADLSTDDLARFAAELEAGQALVAVLDRRRGAERAVVELTGLGGRVELHRITGRALRQAARLAPDPGATPPEP
jgi:hypothetical protein